MIGTDPSTGIVGLIPPVDTRYRTPAILRFPRTSASAKIPGWFIAVNKASFLGAFIISSFKISFSLL
nr:MAG TPA: hypothetical protein [Caudoviricetes sp.]